MKEKQQQVEASFIFSTLNNTEVGTNDTKRPKTLLSPPTGDKKYEDVKLMHKSLTQLCQLCQLIKKRN